MRSLLAIGAMCLACTLAGCDDGSGSAVTKGEMDTNPNVGTDAIKKMGPMPTPKTAMPTTPAAR
jgi:hypothetical protein